MLTPQGRRLDQTLIGELAQSPRLVLLCGRYEGFDERIRLGLAPLEVSVGDFVTNGGGVPAMLIIDAGMRLVPRGLGGGKSSKDDSLSPTGPLGYSPKNPPPEVPRDAGSGGVGEGGQGEDRCVARGGEPGTDAERPGRPAGARRADGARRLVDKQTGFVKFL